jgi:CheY-like chemotaxis protein
MDGLTATRLIREEEKERGGRIPIVALTAHAFQSDRQKSLEAGMDEHLSKPLCVEDLVSMIGRLVPAPERRPVGAAREQTAGGNGSEAPAAQDDAVPFSQEAMLRIELLRKALEAKDEQALASESKLLRDRATRDHVTRIMKNVFRIELALRRGSIDQCGPLIDRLEEDILST